MELLKPRYIVQHDCHVELTHEEFGDAQPFLLLVRISSDNEEEDNLFGVESDGGLVPWDAEVDFVDKGILIRGADGPSGGTHKLLELFIPQERVKSLIVE